jgi:hypothetical protein
MKPQVRLSLLIVLLLLVSLLGVTLTQARSSRHSTLSSAINLSAANLPWHGEYVQKVDSPLDVGAYTSLALNPVNNLAYISYYDAYNGDLMLAHFAPNGSGNCGTDNNWFCESIDQDGDVGRFSSIDLWSGSPSGYKIGISYYDQTNRSFKFTSQTCTGYLCTLWNAVTIDIPVFDYMSVGLYTSLKFTPEGTPVIAYQAIDANTNNNSLRYAVYVTDGGNCGEGSATGKWQCSVIDAGNGIGQYASLALTYDGSPYLAYYDAGAGNLKMAYYTGFADPDCFGNNGWVCPILDSVGDVGLFASITAQHSPSDELFRIAYYDKTNQQLKYYDADFGSVVVDEMGSSLSPMSISLDVDKDGSPVIAYQKIASEFSPPTLQIARPYFVYTDTSFGNCGDVPPGYLFQYWRCSILDNAGQYTEEADFASLVIGPSGYASIAYSEYDSYLDATSLKFITQYSQTFLPLIAKP